MILSTSDKTIASSLIIYLLYILPLFYFLNFTKNNPKRVVSLLPAQPYTQIQTIPAPL